MYFKCFRVFRCKKYTSDELMAAELITNLIKLTSSNFNRRILTRHSDYKWRYEATLTSIEILKWAIMVQSLY